MIYKKNHNVAAPIKTVSLSKTQLAYLNRLCVFFVNRLLSKLNDVKRMNSFKYNTFNFNCSAYSMTKINIDLQSAQTGSQQCHTSYHTSQDEAKAARR